MALEQKKSALFTVAPKGRKSSIILSFFFPFEKVDLNVPVCVKLINNGTTGSYQVTLPLP